MMKIVVFGGAGDMGSRAVEDLALWEGLDQLTIADRDESAARALADRLRHRARTKIVVEAVDARDHGALVRLMKDHQLAASALGPFYLFESNLVAAAIEAGINYCSICDEWQPAVDLFDSYGRKAAEKGCIILTGLGTSPGLSNIGIRHLTRQLDTVENADVYVYQPLDAGGGPAVVEHMLHIISHPVEYWSAGHPAVAPACSMEETVDFPRFGPIKVWNMGHSEPVTVPRYFPDIHQVRFLMGFGEGSEFFIYPARLGLFRLPGVGKLLARGLKFFESLGDDIPEPTPGAVRIDVTGKLNGKAAQRTLCGVGEMREVTGLSLAVGTRMLAESQLITAAPGVYAPEGLLDPDVFIKMMAERGMTAYHDIGMTQPLEA